MARWIDVVREDDSLPGSCHTVEADGLFIAVFNVDGVHYAIEDVCSHEEELLSLGTLEGAEIVCPRHGARFSLLSGEALTPPAYEPVATFPVRVAGGMVQVGDEPCEAKPYEAKP